MPENPFADHQVFCERAIDNLEDMIDLFWEQPFAFATSCTIVIPTN